MVKNKFIIFFLIFAIISIFYSCNPTPVAAITDSNLQPVAVGNVFNSPETILGNVGLSVKIGNNATLEIGFGGENDPKASLTNISGVEGSTSYVFQNGSLSASIRVADTNMIYVTITSLKEPYFNLEDVLCSK